RFATLRGSTWKCLCASGLRTKGLFLGINQLIGSSFSNAAVVLQYPHVRPGCGPSRSGSPHLLQAASSAGSIAVDQARPAVVGQAASVAPARPRAGCILQ